MLVFSFINHILAQENDRRITTALDFLRLNPDARSGGLGDIGTSTSPDVYSQQTSAAKYVFMKKNQGIAISYTPWLNDIINDVYFLNLFYYNKLNEHGAIGASVNYFTYGRIERKSDLNVPLGSINANNLSIDASYSLKLSEHFSMGITGRYIRSDLLDRNTNPNIKVGNSLGVDISGYYEGLQSKLKNFDGRWRFGFSIKHIGPKINYGNLSGKQFQPTTLSLGLGYEFGFHKGTRLSTYFEVDKLLVPTPSNSSDPSNNSNKSVISSIFSSFIDAPDGFSEELKETQFALGLEYSFKEYLTLRSGYHYEDKSKGGQKFLTVGFGVKYNNFGLDFAYLIPLSEIRLMLENGLRFSLSYQL